MPVRRTPSQASPEADSSRTSSGAPAEAGASRPRPAASDSASRPAGQRTRQKPSERRPARLLQRLEEDLIPSGEQSGSESGKPHTKINLRDLAQKVYPIIKQILQSENERKFGHR